MFEVRSFPAWIKAELFRALTWSSDPTRWAQRCQLFYPKLRDLGYGPQLTDPNFYWLNLQKSHGVIAFYWSS